MDRVHISVVIPYYKGIECLDELCDRLRQAIEGSISREFEIVLVDDCSPDAGWKRIEELSRADPRIRGIQFTRNFGQHHAITAGLEASRGDWVVVMDCDLQDRPEEIPRLYAKAQEGHECVLARRIARQDTVSKRFSSWAFYRVFNFLTDLHYDGTVANFSIINRKVVVDLLRMREAVRFYGGFLNWLGYANAFVDVQHDPRVHGKSSYGFFRLLRFSSSIILAHSNKPLKMCVTLGVVIATCSVMAGISVLVRALVFGSPVMGWPTLMVSVYFSTGAIIATLGLVGLYVGRIFSEVRNRPLFVVRRRSFEDG